MELTKYKITSETFEGFFMVVYQGSHFKSVLNEVKTVLNDKQVNFILNHITDDPKLLKGTIEHHSKSKLLVEPVSDQESDQDPEGAPARDKIGIFCAFYEKYTTVKYKTGAAEAGKMKALGVTLDELETILKAYFESDEWYLKPKSISNFIKKYNEVRTIAYARPTNKPKRNYPLPYDHSFFLTLDTNGQREYWSILKANGYVSKYTAGRGTIWVKQNELM